MTKKMDSDPKNQKRISTEAFLKIKALEYKRELRKIQKAEKTISAIKKHGEEVEAALNYKVGSFNAGP